MLKQKDCSQIWKRKLEVCVKYLVEGLLKVKLQKFTEHIIEKLNNKKICCFEKSISYLDEICAKYGLINKIICIIDENQRNIGSFTYQGNRFNVYDMEYLKELDWRETIVLITSDYYKEAYEKLRNNVSINDSVDIIYYFANKETEYEEEYRNKYAGSPLENIILFRSGPHASAYVKGMDFSDNARALYEYMFANGYNEKYDLVWMVKNPDEFRRYDNVPNVKFISFDWSVSSNRQERDSYYRALCLAKYIFFTDAYGFARNCREDQIRVQLWHGCGFKTRVNFVRCEKRYEYMTVISDVYARNHQEMFGLREDQMLITGYAKQDWLFHPLIDWQEKLDVPKAKKYIFWLPTFRTAKEQLQNLNEYELDGQTGLPIVNTYTDMKYMNMLLKEFDIVLILKLHPFQDKEKIGNINFENIVMLDNEQMTKCDIQINQLLGHADAMISDYSSAAVDFMLLNRPIAFTLDDMEEYSQSRGFEFENIKEWIPGMELFSFNDFCIFIKEVGKEIDSTKDKREKLINKMHRYKDDNNCRRIIDSLRI